MENIFSGRMNRLSYFLVQLIISVIYTYSVYRYSSYKPFLEILIIIFIFTTAFITVKRFHDTNKSGWWFLTLFIPFYNIYIGLKLLFGAGDFGDNRFGPAPQKGLKLL